MKETDVRISLDMILASDETLDVELRRAIVEEIIDRFQDVVRDLKLPSGIKWDGFSIDGSAFLGEDRKIAKASWTNLAMMTKGYGQTPDPRRRG